MKMTTCLVRHLLIAGAVDVRRSMAPPGNVWWSFEGSAPEGGDSIRRKCVAVGSVVL